MRESPGRAAVSEDRSPSSAAPSKRKGLQQRRGWALFLLMAPGLVYFLVFPYGALIVNVIAFKEYVPFLGLWGSPWTGLNNFQRLFQDGAFWHAELNTVW